MSLVPSSTTVTTGQAFSVDVVVAGLGAGQAVGAFDFDVTFDASVLSASGVAFGSALGVDGVDLFGSALLSAGRIDFAAVSLLAEVDLLAAQTGPFSIATLSFAAMAPGLSDIRFDLATFPGLLLGDAFGNTLAATVGSETAITVTPGTAAIPEPGALALVLLALGVMAVPRRPMPRRCGA